MAKVYREVMGRLEEGILADSLNSAQTSEPACVPTVVSSPSAAGTIAATSMLGRV